MQKLFILILLIFLTPVICFGQQLRPSFKQGFARSGGEALHPECFRGLVGAWAPSLSGPTGTTMFDVSSRRNHGTLTNMAPATDWTISSNARLPGYALDFDGADDYVAVGNGNSLNDLMTVTYVAWIFPYSEGENNTGMVFFRRPSSGFWMTSTNTITFNIQYSGTDVGRQVTNNSITLNQWNYVAATWDGSINSTGIKIYINGSEQGYQSSSNATGTYTSDASITKKIGNNNPLTFTFDGQIGNILIYKRSLTPAEIKFLYENPIAPFQMRPRLYKAPAIVSTRRVIIISQLIDSLYFDYLWN